MIDLAAAQTELTARIVAAVGVDVPVVDDPALAVPPCVVVFPLEVTQLYAGQCRARLAATIHIVSTWDTTGIAWAQHVLIDVMAALGVTVARFQADPPRYELAVELTTTTEDEP
jgi:hypothetical protein